MVVEKMGYFMYSDIVEKLDIDKEALDKIFEENYNLIFGENKNIKWNSKKDIVIVVKEYTNKVISLQYIIILSFKSVLKHKIIHRCKFQ